jgi:hypothetical protein
VLADGNRIVRSSTSKLYRNSEGRFRREGSGGMTGFFGSHFELNPAISLVAPDVGFRYSLDPNSRTGRAMVLAPAPEGSAQGGVSVVTLPREEIGTRVREEVRAAQAGAPEARGGEQVEKVIVERAMTVVGPEGQTGARGFGVAAASPVRLPKGHSTRTEDLGMQNIEGVDAHGTRTITTIEAGAIGNERPIEIVYERWYSRDLQLVILSRHSDPRFGEQTYRLTNINRSEPDPALFKLPNGYNITSDPGGVYKLTVTEKGQGKTTTVQNKAAANVNVKHNKP